MSFRVHQLLRSSLSFDDFRESRHVENDTLHFHGSVLYIPGVRLYILKADQLSYM